MIWEKTLSDSNLKMQSENLAVFVHFVRNHFVGFNESFCRELVESDPDAKFVWGFCLLHQALCIGLQNGWVLPGWFDVKAEGKRFHQMVAKWLQPKRVRLGHFVFGKQVES